MEVVILPSPNDELLYDILSVLDSLECRRSYTGLEINDMLGELLAKAPELISTVAKSNPRSAIVRSYERELRELRSWRGVFRTIFRKLLGLPLFATAELCTRPE